MNRIKKFRKDHEDAIVIVGAITLTIAAMFVAYSAGVAVANEGWKIVQGDDCTDEDGAILLAIVFKNGRTRYMKHL